MSACLYSGEYSITSSEETGRDSTYGALSLLLQKEGGYQDGEIKEGKGEGV